MALYHSARGSVNYTIVGTPTIVDGVASGFSSSDYLNISSGVSSNSLEVVISLKDIPQVVNNQGCILRLIGNLNLNVYQQENGTVRVYYKGSDGNSKYLPAFDYANVGYFKIVISSTGAEAYYSSDGSSYSAVSSLSVQPYSISFTSARWGYLSSTLQAFQGSIDLNNTYIKVNGQPWFGICPIEVKKHQIMGPVGYTVVGSPTIADGVVSGFSSGNYIATEGDTDFNQPFEISISCIKGPNRNQSIFCRRTQNNGVDVTFPYNNICTIRLWLNNSLIYNVVEVMGGFVLEENTKYVMKFTYDGNDRYYFAILSHITKDVLYARTIIESTKLNNCGVTFGGLFGGGRLYNPWEGSIDLNETYIKVNGKLWFWQPQETKYIQRNNQLVWADPRLYLSGPVNYTVVGNPTIVDGVASEFTTTDYVTTQSAPQDTDVRNYELFTKIRINSIPTSTEFIMCYEAGAREGISIMNGGRIRFQTSRAIGTTGEPSIYSSACSTGDEVLIHTYYKGNNIWVLEISKDNGATWETNTLTVITQELSEMNTSRVFTIGGSQFYSSSYKFPFISGSIDLNNTYIKVNNELWFYGKNYASQNIAPVPSEYTFGTTTTSSIGYVDMRTQQFTPAPEGATIGMDE